MMRLAQKVSAKLANVGKNRNIVSRTVVPETTCWKLAAEYNGSPRLKGHCSGDNDYNTVK